MAAKATLDRNSSPAATPLPPATAAQELFQRVYMHLKNDQMPLAVALIKQEGEKVKLNEDTKKQILDGISPMVLTPETRAEKFVSILNRLKDQFPGVKPEDFERVRRPVQNSILVVFQITPEAPTAAASGPQKTAAPSETAKNVKPSGVEAAPSKSLTDNSQVEIVIDRTGAEQLLSSTSSSLGSSATATPILIIPPMTSNHATPSGIRGAPKSMADKESIEIVIDKASSSQPLSSTSSSVRSNAASALASSAIEDLPEILNMVKDLGVDAGLSQGEVDRALEEIVLEDGSKSWLIKTTVDDRYKDWELSLIKLSSHELMTLFCRGCVRGEQEEDLTCSRLGRAQRGLFRGLETQRSKHQWDLIWALEDTFYVKTSMVLEAANRLLPSKELEAAKIFLPEGTAKKKVETSEKNFRKSLTTAISNCYYYKDAQNALAQAANHSEIGTNLLASLKFQLQSMVSADKFESILSELMQIIPDVYTWEDLLLLLAESAFAPICTPSLKEALVDFLIAHGELGRTSSTWNYNNYLKSKELFFEEWNNVRDPEYARVFNCERSSMPRNKPCFVLIGQSHVVRFKQALTTDRPLSVEGMRDRADEKKNRS